MKKVNVTTVLMLLGVILTPTASADIKSSGEAFNTFAIGVSYLLGVVTFGYGLYGIYQISGANAQRETLRSCILSIITGASLLSIGSMYGMWFDTVYGGGSSDSVRTLIAVDPNLLLGNGSADSFISKHIPAKTQAGIIAALKLFGLCAFIKGTYLIKDVGQVEGGQKVGVPKVLSHILGGMALVNLPKFSCAVSNFVGLPYLCIVGS